MQASINAYTAQDPSQHGFVELQVWLPTINKHTGRI